MIVLQFVLAKFAEDAATPMQELALLANHKSVGITIFLCACLRLAWRLRQGVPPPLPMPGWQAIASRISHLSPLSCMSKRLSRLLAQNRGVTAKILKQIRFAS